LDLSHLQAGRIFRYSGGFASGYRVARSLVDLVVAGPRTEWDYDVVSFLKGRDPTLALAFGGYGLYRSDFAAPCYTAGQLGFYGGLGLYSTPWIGCGPVFYGPTTWWYPGGGTPVALGPGQQKPGEGSTFVRTDSMSVGFPRARDRDRVVSRDPGRANVHARDMNPEQVRQLLERLADARTPTAADPRVLVRERQGFRRVGVSDPSGVSLEMAAQGIEASKRLEGRLRHMGLSPERARQAAGSPGPAPRVHFSGGHATLGGVHAPAPRARSGAAAPSHAPAPRRPAPSHGSAAPQRSQPPHVSRPSHVSPPARVRSRSHVSRPSLPRASHPSPVHRSRPASSSGSGKGGGGGSG
ncbi:MAG TPA: hypothetical protein VKA44_01035, partial [Gemmatimonadota bacterium]|nr:hypothetical protein [Gemmatimonadota bacterium]